MTEARARQIAAFFAKVSFGRSCWTWTGSRQNQKRLNYGLFRYLDEHGRPRRMVAHKFAFLISGRELYPGDEVGHKCHNHLCVRFDHLEAQDRVTNQRLTWRPDGKRRRKLAQKQKRKERRAMAAAA